MNEKKFTANLLSLIPKIESFIDDVIIIQRPMPVSTMREKIVKNYPNWAIRELMMNAIMHRDYESNAPVKFYQFDDRIEISNAGGLYGKARPENFPNENDYRNPTIAEAMKVLGYVNRFNRGICRVQEELTENGNPKAIFDFDKITVFSVTVQDALYTSEIETIILDNLDTLRNKFRNKFGINSVQIRNKLGEVAYSTLIIIADNPHASASFVAKLLNVTSRTIENNIAVLKKENILERLGSRKKGYWKINPDKLIKKSDDYKYY